MSANEAYQYRFDGKLYHHNQAEIVAFDVENVVLIADTIHAVERALHIGETSPLRSFCLLIPLFQSHFCRSVYRVVFYDFTSCNDSHCYMSDGAKLQHFFYIAKYFMEKQKRLWRNPLLPDYLFDPTALLEDVYPCCLNLVQRKIGGVEFVELLPLQIVDIGVGRRRGNWRYDR